MADIALPFARGTTFDSGAFGIVPSDLLGQRFTLRDGLELRIMKNTDGIVLVGAYAVRFKTPESNAVEAVSNASEPDVAGVVDEEYANAGVTVPINSLFWMVTGGYHHCIAGAVTTVGAALGSHTTAGRVQDAGDPSGASQEVFGTILESGNAADSVAVLIKGIN